jgi:hypothetical protein
VTKFGVLLVAAGLTLAPAAPAFAYRDGGRGGRCEGREGNCNDQRRCQGDNCTDNHKSFSPDLKDSPTTLVVCLPGSTCNFDGNGQKKAEPAPQK